MYLEPNINDLDPDIKFTLQKNFVEIPFLDVLVHKEQSKITTGIFYKTNDTHQYLQFGSSHPRQIKRAVSYNLARRICTIVNIKKKPESSA
jgi:RNase P protein component